MPFIVIKFKSLKITFILILVIIMLSVGSSNATAASVYFGGSIREIPIYCVENNDNEIAITFDAGWGADKTESIINLLKEYNVKATFFLVGFWVESYPELVKKIHNAGYEIGVHSTTHKDMTKMNKAQIINELQITKNLIENLTNEPITLFRAPFGAYNNTLITTAKDLGLTTIQWDVDSLDWKGLTPEQMTLRVLNGVKSGSIILLHNNSDNIVEGLRLILDRLTKKGYKITSVGNLILKDNYYIDATGQQRKN